MRSRIRPSSLPSDWEELLAIPSRPAGSLTQADVPLEPGVYLWSCDQEPVYVGTAKSLRTRVWGRHLGAGRSLAGSSLRRSVGELLFGIPTTVTGGPRREKVSAEQAATIRTWLGGCDVSWKTCDSEAAAGMLEKQLRATWLPPLNRV